MKLTYTMAQAMAITALIPAWIPTINSWSFHDPRAVMCWLVALSLLTVPLAWDNYGPGLKLA